MDPQARGEGAGDEALILTRSLLSLAARSAYVDEPIGTAERKQRFSQYNKRLLQDQIEAVAGMRAIGFEVEADIDRLRNELSSLSAVPPLPNDRDLLHGLGLDAYYQRLYRQGSEYVHFSLRLAIQELVDVDEVSLERSNPELADEALRLAILTYGVFLRSSERTIGHDLGHRSLELAKSLPELGGERQTP